MEGTARSCAQIWVCSSFCTCCQCKSAKFAPIDKSAPPPICSSSDLQLDSKHSQDHGSPEADTVDPEPSSSAPGSAFGSKNRECDCLSLTEKNEICIFTGSQKIRGRVRSPQPCSSENSASCSCLVFTGPFLLDLISQSWQDWTVKKDKLSLIST